MLDRAGVEEVADQREAVEAALVGRAGAVLESVPDRPQTADVVGDARRRVLELGREPALDMGAHLGPEPEQQAPAADPLQVPRGLCERIGGAGEGDRDPDPQPDALGRERRDQQRQERVVHGLVAPQPVGAEPLVGGRLAAEPAQVTAAQA